MASYNKITPEIAAQLKAVVDAPLLSGEENTNEARNANDPASVIPAEPCGKNGGARRSIVEVENEETCLEESA